MIREHNKNTAKTNYMLQQYRMNNSENERYHLSASYEAELIRCVKECDLSGLEKLASGIQIDSSIGTISTRNFKQHEYAAVVAITLVSRAAIEVGLHPNTSYEMSDVFFQALSNTTDISQMNHIIADMLISYITEIQRIKSSSSRSLHVEDAKNYIIRNLNKKIKLNDIAENCNISVPQLSSLFKKYENLSVMEFLQKERISAASNMLKYSDFSISEIANYFYFATPSHFCSVFKKALHMTPSEYRNRYHTTDF